VCQQRFLSGSSACAQRFGSISAASSAAVVRSSATGAGRSPPQRCITTFTAHGSTRQRTPAHTGAGQSRDTPAHASGRGTECRRGPTTPSSRCKPSPSSDMRAALHAPCARPAAVHQRRACPLSSHRTSHLESAQPGARFQRLFAVASHALRIALRSAAGPSARSPVWLPLAVRRRSPAVSLSNFRLR
jgi:hypothetical protein